MCDVQRTGDVPLRFHIFRTVWAHESEPLFDAALNVSAALAYVAEDYSQISDVPCATERGEADSRRLDRHRSLSASVKIFRSSRSRTRWSWRAKIPSRTSTCGEYMVVV